LSRILTTHVGSLPRPHALLDLMKERLAGREPPGYAESVRKAVMECVRKQVEMGIDIVSDGEQSKPGFFAYVKERLRGFEPRADRKTVLFPAEVEAFPEYYEQYFREAMMGGAVAPYVPLVRTDAVAAAMRTEYKAIVDAGLTLQIDDPFLCDVLADPRLDAKRRKKLAWLHVEAINAAIKGLPEEKIRFHTCYGINEGPRVHDVPMSEVARYMLRVNAGAYSFEHANVRHEHEYVIWDDIKLPDGKKLIPGMLLHASNVGEVPGVEARCATCHPAAVEKPRQIAIETEILIAGGGPCGPKCCPYARGRRAIRWSRSVSSTAASGPHRRLARARRALGKKSARTRQRSRS